MSPGARILVVEDDPRVRAATVGALEDLDYEPVACASGAEAIEMFDAQEFDLVISDVIMPEMTGPELIRHLKATQARDFAVLFVTGYVGEGESDDLRGNELLRKPFTVGALAKRGLRRARPAPQRTAPDLSSRGKRVSAASSGWRRCQGLSSIVGAGVAVDLPGDIIGAAGEGEAGLGEPGDRVELALALLAVATTRRSARPERRLRSRAAVGEPLVALGVSIDDLGRPVDSFRPQFGTEGEAKARFHKSSGAAFRRSCGASSRAASARPS